MIVAVPLIFLALAQATPPASSAFQQAAAQAEAARKNNSPEAAALFARALKMNAVWKEGWWSLGTIHYQQDHYAECRDAFTKLSKLDPKSGPAWTMVGLCE